MASKGPTSVPAPKAFHFPRGAWPPQTEPIARQSRKITSATLKPQAPSTREYGKAQPDETMGY